MSDMDRVFQDEIDQRQRMDVQDQQQAMQEADERAKQEGLLNDLHLLVYCIDNIDEGEMEAVMNIAAALGLSKEFQQRIGD